MRKDSLKGSLLRENGKNNSWYLENEYRKDISISIEGEDKIWIKKIVGFIAEPLIHLNVMPWIMV